MPCAPPLSLGALVVALAVLTLVGCATPAAERERSTVSVMTARPSGGLVQEGKASWYGREQHGKLTANGERFNMHALTAAHRTLRMNTQVRVTNLRNGRSVVVRINDRGPYGRGRIIDVSQAAALQLDMIGSGVVPARVEVMQP
jgi:rare lipoprotein A